MTDRFFKFPSTPHLLTLPGIDIRDDKVLTGSECSILLRNELTVEEKVDGANLGISFDAEGNIHAQNRGDYLRLPWSGQWKKLGEWLAPRTDVLLEHLSDRFILFGEWCCARHSLFYDRLPDWFLAFDIYDRQSERFLSSPRRDRILGELNVCGVPTLARGNFSLSALQTFMARSKLTDQPAEGIYVRVDHGDWLVQRAKLVRAGFIQNGDQHWSRSGVKPNKLLPKVRS